MTHYRASGKFAHIHLRLVLVADVNFLRRLAARAAEQKGGRSSPVVYAGFISCFPYFILYPCDSFMFFWFWVVGLGLRRSHSLSHVKLILLAYPIREVTSLVRPCPIPPAPPCPPVAAALCTIVSAQHRGDRSACRYRRPGPLGAVGRRRSHRAPPGHAGGEHWRPSSGTEYI